ncbi:unnamed protein product [Discula destructiva]
MSYSNNSSMTGDQNRHNRQAGHSMASAPYSAQGGGHDGPAMHYPVQHDGLAGLIGQFSGMSVAPGNVHQGVPMAMAPAAYMGTDVPVGYPTYGGHPVHPGMVLPHEAYFAGGLTGSAYMQPAAAPTTFGSYIVPYTPGRAASYGDRLERPFQRELPGLDNRRASYSTTATESTPGTPFFGAVGGDSHKNPRILSGERSSYTTPSPQQLAVSGMIGQVTPKAKRIAEADLRALMELDPAIPAAVPAVFTTPEQRKSLDQCLENRIAGNKNCYIRGLHPTTDDELLLKFCERFGEVEQSKAIIDTATGACKGFGFAKFKDVRDSEKCIQGFYILGYEVGFARESFNARLKAEGDDDSTNLYISNLPKTMTEAALVAVFHPYQILSSKILRDSMGNSRGVGFARFETRDVCKEVIQQYHGFVIGDDGLAMQVRYADTPAQKELKRITAERRQYRTNEYNIGAYGSMAVGQTPTIYGTGSWGRSTRFSEPSTRGHYRSVLSVRSGNANMVTGRAQLDIVTTSSEDGFGSTDEGVTVIDSPTNVKSQSSPSVKKEAA